MKVCRIAGTRVTPLTAFEPLTTSIHKAIIVVVVSALLSILAFAFIAVRIIQDAAFNRTSRHPKILFFRTQLGHYSGCLILSNVFISVAGVIDIYWLIGSGLTPGSTCSAQAVLMQIGVWGTCWFTVMHGVHTLISLVFCVRQVFWHSAVIIAFGWAIAFVAALVPLKKGNVYGPAGISCSITHSYPNEMIFLGALPIVLSTFLTTAVHSLSFFVWHRKQSASNRRKIRASSSDRCRENKPADYHKLINMVIWTMFWFPLAFVLLMLPFCIIRILVHAGQQVSVTLNIFADACASILGFVNVCLLFNTLQVISHMCRAAEIAAEMMTFGHDASRESPAGPHFHAQSEVLPYESRKHNSTQASHSHSSSCSSVDSNTELMCAEKTSYASTQTKAAPLSMHIIPPPELGRQLDNEPGIISPGTHNKRYGHRFGTVTPTSPMVNISLSPPSVGGETGVTKQGSRMRDERYLFEPMADTAPFGKGAEELGFGPKVPLKVDLSTHPVRPPPISYSVTGKLAAPATRKIGVPAPSSDIAPQIPAAFLGPKNPNLSIHRVSTASASSYASTSSSSFSTSSSLTSTLSTDSDSDYSGELMHAYKVRLSSQVPQLGDDEEVFRGSLLPIPQRRSAWARRTTLDSIWSQESEDMTEDESQEAYWQLIAELLGDLGVTMGDEADAPAAGLRRQSTFGPRDARPQTLRVQPRTRAMSKCPVHFADTSRLNTKLPTTKCAPNQSVV